MESNLTQRDYALHRRLAASFFNQTWSLLDKTDRTPDDDARMIHIAHASRMHWEIVGTPQNRAVGEWQIARVYGVLGRIDSALYHARRCLETMQAAGITGFYLGSAHEGMARALRLAGDSESEKHVELARSILKTLNDSEDREVLEGDLASLPPAKRGTASPGFSNVDDVNWQTFAVERIVALKSPTPLWRILSEDLNAYLCDRNKVVEALQTALNERRVVKAGVTRDVDDREWIVSLSVTEELAKASELPAAMRKSPQLLF